MASLRKKDIALLVFLCLEGLRSYTRSRLAELLWSDSPEEKARQSLTQAVGRLRAVLPAGSFVLGHETVEWQGHLACDALELEAGSRSGAAAADLVSGYTADFLNDFDPGKGAHAFELWAEPKRTFFRLLAVGLLDQLGAQAEARQAWADALELAKRQVEVDRISEEGHRRVMRAWAAMGERTRAMRHYDDLVCWLGMELEEEPDPATVALMEELRAVVSVPAPRGPVSRTPDTELSSPSEAGIGSADPPWNGPSSACGAETSADSSSESGIEACLLASADAPAVSQAGGRGNDAAAPVPIQPPGFVPPVDIPSWTDRDPGGVAAAQPPTTSSPSQRSFAGRKAVAAGLAIAVLSAAIGFWARGWEDSGDGSAQAAVIARATEDRILFMSDRDGRQRLYSMKPDGSDVVPSPPEIDPPNSTVSPDGQYRAISPIIDGNQDVFIIGPGDRDTLNISASPGQDDFGAWAPDGRRLLFTSYRNGNADIFSVARDGSDLRQLTVFAGNDDQPCWSPDGSRIAYRSWRDGARELWTMHADGRNSRPLTRNIVLAGCSYSLDGAWILYRDDGPDAPGLSLVRTDGSEFRAFPSIDQASGSEVWSPDGEWLAVASRRDGDLEVYRVRLDGTALENLTRDTARDVPVAWTGGRGPRWIDRVTIGAGIPRSLSQGERHGLSARAFDQAGLYFYGAPIRWESTDTSVAVVDSMGMLTARSRGHARIIASAGGWRGDTLDVLVEAGTVRHLLDEDFERGIDPEKWQIFGDPKPYVAAGVGSAESRGFVNNGDDYYESGIATRHVFETRNGLTIEFSAAAAITSHVHQELVVSLYELKLNDAGALELGNVFGREIGGPRVLWFRLGGLAILEGRPIFSFGSTRLGFPSGQNPADWHRYVIQLRPGGWQDLYMDGRLIATSPPLADLADIPRVRLILGARSLGTMIVHDDVAIYEGLRITHKD